MKTSSWWPEARRYGRCRATLSSSLITLARATLNSSAKSLRKPLDDLNVAEEMSPRFDLAYWIGRVAEMESSRNCNFRCSFCTLTGEGRGYEKYSLEVIRRQILAMGRHDFLFFIDNNFYGNDRIFFLERMDLLRESWRKGHFGKWGALVTNDFFLRDENLTLARESGCTALFSGVESFSSAWLKKMNKRQNSSASQVGTIRKCLDAGIVFLY